MKNPHVGKKVICFSHDRPDLIVGTYMGIDRNCHNVRIVRDEKGLDLMVGGIILPWSPQLYEFLIALDTKQRWRIFTDLVWFTKEHADERWE